MAKKQPSYEELRDKWYAKLKRKGFDDIEDNQGRLKVYTSTLAGNNKRKAFQHGGWQVKAEYYNLADRFLNEYKFDKKIEKVIWEYHTNGIGVRDIAKTLNKVRTVKTTYSKVWKTVNKLKMTMYSMYLEPKKAYHE